LAAFFVYNENSKENQIAENPEPVKKEISVYVSGQVKTPAVVTLEDNGKLMAIDAVNAVGGLTDLADTEIVNLAEPLFDGQHIHIPTKEILFQEIPVSAPNSPANKSFGGAQGDLININVADEKELQKIRGVGPVIAGRIIEYRTNNGAFKSIEEIKKVRGIGEKTFEKMKDSITVN
jgi:competence protein ComEA